MKLRYLIFSAATAAMISCTDIEDNNTENSVTDNSAAPVSTTQTEPEKPIITEGKATSISGTITGMETGKKIFFDRKTLDATEIKGITLVKEDGSFALTSGVKAPGIFRIRLGARPIWMLLKGGENVVIEAEMDGYKIKNYTLSGALFSEEMKVWNTDLSVSKISKHLTKSKEAKPLLDLFLVLKLDLAANLKLYKKVLRSLQTSYPNDTYTKQFASRVLSMEAKMKSQPLSVGAKAPEINLPDPDGKKRSLSSLRGKVVLLDFWASWCRPCRMSNPHVVEMYKKYNNKGFDVFNVSLDGIDDKRAAMYQNDAKTIAQATEIERGKWRQAIKTDNLDWKNHVSELRSWSSPVAALYKVSSIPKTYLLDKKGIIRYENLRGPALEEAIKVLVSE